MPMTKSRISDSKPLLKELACVSSISFATSLSDTTTNFFGPMARMNISPYARKSLYRGTNTGWPAISRMSPAATGMRLMDSFLHLRESLARDTESPRAVRWSIEWDERAVSECARHRRRDAALCGGLIQTGGVRTDAGRDARRGGDSPGDWRSLARDDIIEASIAIEPTINR